MSTNSPVISEEAPFIHNDNIGLLSQLEDKFEDKSSTPAIEEVSKNAEPVTNKIEPPGPAEILDNEKKNSFIDANSKHFHPFMMNLTTAILAVIAEGSSAAIDWEKVRTRMISADSDLINLTVEDCSRIWKKAAYGGNATNDDSDEESYFDFSLRLLDYKAEDMSSSSSLTSHLTVEKKLRQEAKKLKFLVPEQIYDGDASRLAPTFSSPYAFCQSRDLQVSLRPLSSTVFQDNSIYKANKRRKFAQQSEASSSLGAMGIFAELAASHATAATRWVQGQVRHTPLYKSRNPKPPPAPTALTPSTTTRQGPEPGSGAGSGQGSRSGPAAMSAPDAASVSITPDTSPLGSQAKIVEGSGAHGAVLAQRAASASSAPNPKPLNAPLPVNREAGV